MMNSINKKAPEPKGMPEPFKRPAVAPQFKSAVAQAKTSVSAPSVKRPVAPPVYKPQPRQVGVQAKTAVAAAKSPVSRQGSKRPIAPPVYRPQAGPAKVQAKMAGASQVKKHSAAPPVYRPQALPKVLQTKKAVSQPAGHRHGVVQCVFRAVAGQEGEFEGDPAAHHLHRVGGGEHYRFGNGHRTNYIHGGVANYDGIQRAIEACEGNADANVSGRAECLVYLRALLAETPRPKVVVVELKKDPPPPPKKGGGGGGGGGKRAARLNKLGDALVARRQGEVF